MLTLTENATSVIRAMVERPDVADGAGLRIATATEEERQGLTVTPAISPGDDDVVIEGDGARVFLEPEAAAVLDDQVLDARVDSDGRVEFMLATV